MSNCFQPIKPSLLPTNAIVMLLNWPIMQYSGNYLLQFRDLLATPLLMQYVVIGDGA